MRALLALILVGGIWLSLVVGAFALDQFGLSGRILGTIMIAVAFWGTGLLRASQWVFEGSEGEDREVPTSEAIEEESEPEPPRPWWRRRYNLSPAQVLLFSGLGGIVVGCIVAISLNERSFPSFLVWGGSLGIEIMMVVATIRLMDERHPHHGMFIASVNHVLRVAFLALFVLGFWQSCSAGFMFAMLAALSMGIVFTLGAFWSFALLVRAAVRSVADPESQTL
jgi:hypothetical protein